MPTMEKILTIIIPVFKVEKFIRQCLNSVILDEEQMKWLEVIVVNDGTPDQSGIIAHEYEAKYPQSIKVIDKENGGHGSTWNVGLKNASGKYIRFLDSDDWLSNLSPFLQELRNHDEDLVFTNLVRFNEQNQTSSVSRIKNIQYNKEYTTSSFSYINSGNDYYMYGFWYCTYKKDIFQDVQPLFVEKVFYDDAILFMAPYFLGKTMVFMDTTLYNYRIGQSGQSVNVNVERKHAIDYVKVSKSLVEFANRHHNINEVQKEQRNAFLSQYMKNRFSLFSQLPYREFKSIIEDFLPYIQKNAPYIRLSPKTRFYKALPDYLGWFCIQLFNKFVLRIQ